MKKKILLGGFDDKQIYKLKKKYKLIEFINYNKKIKNIKKIDGFVSTTRKSFEDFYYKDLNKYQSDISWIHIAGAGVEKYFMNKKINSKCTVTHAKIIQGPQVADHALALILSLTRNLNLVIKHGPFHKFKRRPIELRNKNALVVGYGGIGRCVAERAKGFGMNIDVVDRRYSPISNIVNNFYLSDEYYKALKEKDVIFYTLPLTQSSKKLFNEQSMKYIKKGAFIINVCRGDVVCTKTLYKYLKNNYLGGAGLDVIDNEPIKKNNKILKLSNLLFSPHLAGISDNLSKRTFKLIEDNLMRFSKNQELINKLNLKEGY